MWARLPDLVATVKDDLGLWQVCGCGDPGAWIGAVLPWTEHRVALLAQRFGPALYDKRLLGATRCSRYSLHGLYFGLSQPQTHYWIHRLLPVLRRALVALDMAPERDASRVATRPLMLEGAPAGALDGTERRRQRPTDAAQQTAHYSGKKKAHTDKNVLLINAYTSTVVYLSPTVAGKTHDKKAVDKADLVYPVNSTLDKDTGFQGYEPAGVLTQQPKKSREARS